MVWRVVKVVLAVACSAALAVSLFAAGFAACTLQPATRLLSTFTSDFANAPYTHDQLVRLAVATRDFTVEPYVQGEEFAKGTLGSAVMDAAYASAGDVAGGKLDRWADGQIDAAYAAADQPDAGNGSAAYGRAIVDFQAMVAMGEADDAYALDADAVRHLVDCNALINAAVPVLWTVFGVACACGVVLLVADRRALGRAMTVAPALLLAAMVAAGAWAALDWQGFFAAFHGLLFPQGNWVFSSRSLLICMLPTAFWMGMGAIWLALTVIACIISLVIGRKVTP